MVTLLIILNVILIIIVIFIAVKNQGEKEKVFSTLEGIELIEFQQNLKQLIEELNNVTEIKIREMDEKKSETEKMLKEFDIKTKELRYLIERQQIMRKTDYKAEFSKGPSAVPEKPVQQNLPLDREKIREEAENSPKKSARFVINEKEEKEEPAASFSAAGKTKDKYSHISALLQNGMQVEEIAKVTGLTRGEIELIKNIKK